MIGSKTRFDIKKKGLRHLRYMEIVLIENSSQDTKCTLVELGNNISNYKDEDPEEVIDQLGVGVPDGVQITAC